MEPLFCFNENRSNYRISPHEVDEAAAIATAKIDPDLSANQFRCTFHGRHMEFICNDRRKVVSVTVRKIYLMASVNSVIEFPCRLHQSADDSAISIVNDIDETKCLLQFAFFFVLLSNILINCEIITRIISHAVASIAQKKNILCEFFSLTKNVFVIVVFSLNIFSLSLSFWVTVVQMDLMRCVHLPFISFNWNLFNSLSLSLSLQRSGRPLFLLFAFQLDIFRQNEEEPIEKSSLLSCTLENFISYAFVFVV